jgi:pimeloyl-ACP methyl ester carboxylesterase
LWVSDIATSLHTGRTTLARPPIVLIHGAFSNGHHFARWKQYFGEAGFECHAPTLPGHSPTDQGMLASLTLDDYLAFLRAELSRLSVPPVIIGHSMGGLLAQQLASTGQCRALVLVASAPPFMLNAQLRAQPFLLPAMLAILAGRPVRPPQSTLRTLALHDLPEAEQHELLPTFGAESGRAYRAMVLGLARLPDKPFSGPVLCLSGSADRIISKRASAAIARLYGAQHKVFNRGHWLIARSAEIEVAGIVLEWLEKALMAE